MENTIQHLYCKKPCGNCPFKKDTMKGWLGHRIREIVKADSFTCHKDNSRQCAGHMLLNGLNNVFVRLARIENIDLGLSGSDTIFDSPDDCINHHENN